MKRSIVLLVVTISSMLVSLPVFSVAGMEGAYGGYGQGGQHGQYVPEGKKDECLLVAMNCANQVDSIQQRIVRIHNEINRGMDVYTKDELKTLNDRLEDANMTLEELVVSGGA